MATCDWEGGPVALAFRKEPCGWRVTDQESQKAQGPGWLDQR